MAVEIISWSISTKLWDQAQIELATPGSTIRHVTDCAKRPYFYFNQIDKDLQYLTAFLISSLKRLRMQSIVLALVLNKLLALWMLSNFASFFCCLLTFFHNNNFSKLLFLEHQQRLSNSFDPTQVRHFVGPPTGSKLFAVGTNRWR